MFVTEIHTKRKNGKKEKNRSKRNKEKTVQNGRKE